MDRGAFRTLVKAYTEYEGSTFLASDSEYNDWINKGCDLFAVLTACLYTNFAALTLAASSQTFDLTDEAVCSPRVWLASSVVILKEPLFALDGKPGPLAAHEFASVRPHGASNDRPKRWAREQAHKIVFDCPCGDAYSGSFVCGYALPTKLSTENAAADATEIGLPMEYHPIAAMFTAALILDPRAAGGQLERLSRIDKRAGDYMEALTQQGNMVVRGVLGLPPLSVDQKEAV